jgi:nucleoside-diphosphate-sugar epimerase
MRLLVIGSEGFAGGALVRQACARGVDVVGASHHAPSGDYEHFPISREKSNYPELMDIVRPNAIVMAAATGSVGKAQGDGAQAFRDSVGSLADLLVAVRERQADCRVVHMSSMAVYGNAMRRPTPESEALEPVSTYGRLKRVAERVCQRASQAGVKTCSLRVASLYGRGQRKQLFWDIARRLARQPAELTLFGDGMETRDFVYVDDFADVVLELIERAPFAGEAINVATGESITVKSAAQQLTGYLGYHGPIRFLGESPPHDPRHFEADVTRLNQLTSTRLRPFEEGVCEMAAWLRDELGGSVVGSVRVPGSAS